MLRGRLALPRHGTLLLLLLLLTTPNIAAVGTWEREVLSFPNPSYSGNPFELEIDGTFTHTGTSTSITLPGYYAGSDIWKIGFMPTLAGEWTYTTSSPDSDLDNQQGSISVTASGLPGMLKADPAHPKKWKFTDGDYTVPIALRMEFFSEPASQSEFEAAAAFLATNNIHMMETRLTEEYGMFSGRHDWIFEGHWGNHEFDLDNWDRMEERMDALAARGIGAHVMFYSDDDGEPGWDGKSDTEALVIRYVVARLAGYPVVWFNSGIDIAEYRSQSDINWWGAEILALDPYVHPISSRTSGGSGSHVLSGRTFDSQGHNQAEIDVMIGHFEDQSIPVSMDDAWGENRGSHPDKDHSPQDIRRAFWKALAAGGVGGLMRGGGDGLPETGFYRIDRVESDLESEQWLRLINPYIATKLGATFATMEPASSLVSGSGMYALADPQRTKIHYYSIGDNDEYDNGGGDITLRLNSLSNDYQGVWFDPRSGTETSAGSFSGGSHHVVTPPSDDDWVLLLEQWNVACQDDPNYNQACTNGTGACQATGTYVCDDPAALNEVPYCNAVPGAPSPETCNLVDDNCDGQVDEAFDLDLDGYFDGASCGGVYGMVDCADGNASIHPGALEICDNGVDENCNGNGDETEGSGCFTVESGMVGYYPFDGSAVDMSGSGNDGAVSGAILATGHDGQAYDFDGSNDYINLGNDASLQNLAEFTYAAWIYPTDDGTKNILSKDKNKKELRLQGTGSTTHLRGCVRSGNSNYCSQSSDGSITLNTWQHVAVTYNDLTDRKPTLYINGVEVTYSNQPTASGTLNTDDGQDLNIGRRTNNNDRHFQGTIDDVRIYNRALSPGEIANIGTPTTTCNDGIQNQGETGVDCGGPCPACAPTCSDGIQNGDETGVDCGGGCPACQPTCSDGIQNQGETGIDCGGPCTACSVGELLAHYAFDGNTNDKSGKGNHATNNGATFVAGRIGQGISFDGNNGYIALPNFPSGLTDFTVALWVYWNGGADWQRIIDFNDGTNLGASSGKYWYLLPQNDDNNLAFAITDSGYNNNQLTEGAALTTSTWTHVALVKSGNQVTIYKDGTQYATGTASLNPNELNTVNHWLGRSGFTSDPYFDGLMDEVYFYNYALSVAEIQTLYQDTGTGCTNTGDLNCDNTVNIFDLVRAANPKVRPGNWVDLLLDVFNNFGMNY